MQCKLLASRTKARARPIVVALGFTVASILAPWHAAASSLLAPSAGAADGAAAGATIAEPLSPLGAQFSNPAGLGGFTDRAMGLGLGLAYGQGEVTADAPIDYHADNEVLVPFLQTYGILPYGRWTFGMSSLATSGARFDYGPRPNAGVNDGFFSESGILGLPIGAAYRVSDTLWLGAQIIPLYGTTHLRYSREVAEIPGTDTPFRFTVAGFGVQGMFGVTWKPSPAWALGASVKPPGRIWAEGDTKLANGKQDVDLNLEVPLEVAAGITRALGSKWKLSYGLRFTDTSVLRTSYIRFADTPSANMPYLPNARDEWRHAIGAEYAWSEAIRLLGGVSKANGIVGNYGTTPSSYDSRDVHLTGGLGWKGQAWSIDSAFTYIFGGNRRIPASDALVFPGEYDSKPAYVLAITIAKKF